MSQSGYWDNVLRERLSRRKMLKGGLLAGAGLVGATVIGCGNSQPKPSSATTPTTSGSTVKKPYQGSFTFMSNYGSPKGTDMDPHRKQHNLSTWIQWTDDLVMADETGTTDKGLATSWSVAPDGLSWTFKLRKGVLFHDETEFTAEDVKFSFERQMKMKESAAQPILGGFYDHCEIIDPYQVKIVLKQPQMAFLVHSQLLARILPKKYIEKVGDDYFLEHVVGTGPWKVSKWNPGVSIDFEAFEKHFARGPKFQKMTTLPLPDRATQLAMLQSGELDVATNIPLTEVDQIKAISGMQLLVKPEGGISHEAAFVYTGDDGPGRVWHDERIRKAFMYSFNREKMAKVWGKELASPAVNMTYPYTFGYNSNLKAWPYDPQKAKQLLTEAGYPNGLDITFVYSPTATAAAEIEAAPVLLNETGLFRIKEMNPSTDWGPLLQNKRVLVKDKPSIMPGMVGSLYAYAGDVGYLAETYWAKTAMWGFPTGDAKFEEMVDTQRSIVDIEKRRKFLQDMLQYMHDKQLFAMFLNAPYIAALGPKIKPDWKTFGHLNPWLWNVEPKAA